MDTLCQALVDLESSLERKRSLSDFPHLRISSLNAT